jgi:hypothetical protein
MITSESRNTKNVITSPSIAPELLSPNASTKNYATPGIDLIKKEKSTLPNSFKNSFGVVKASYKELPLIRT